jgi:hypothetical protein
MSRQLTVVREARDLTELSDDVKNSPLGDIENSPL